MVATRGITKRSKMGPIPRKNKKNITAPKSSLQATASASTATTNPASIATPNPSSTADPLPPPPKETASNPIMARPDPSTKQSSTTSSFESQIQQVKPMFSLDVIAEEITNNHMLFGSVECTEMLKQLQSTSADYTKRKKQIVERLFYILSQCPTLSALAESIDDPEARGKQTHRFFISLRGLKNPQKKHVLNNALLVFSQLLIKKAYHGRDMTDDETFANAQYEPNYVQTIFKMLFSEFSNQGITYRLMKDFNAEGELMAYWRYIFEKVKRTRADYGTTPNAAIFDEDWRAKRAIAIKAGRLDPVNNYKHHIMVLTEELMCCNNLRGGKEPASLRIEDFEWGVFSEGDFEGQRYVKLRSEHAGQKNNTLTMANPTVANASNLHCYVPIPETDDPTGLYNLLRRQIFTFLDPESFDSRILRREASDRQRKEWEKKGLPYRAGPGKIEVFGRNYPNTILVELAKICEYTNPQHNTGHGKRKCGNSALVNSKENIASKIVRDITRHKSDATNTRYQKPNQVSLDKAIRALQPSSKMDMKEPAAKKTTQEDENSSSHQHSSGPSRRSPRDRRYRSSPLFADNSRRYERYTPPSPTRRASSLPALPRSFELDARYPTPPEPPLYRDHPASIGYHHFDSRSPEWSRRRRSELDDRLRRRDIEHQDELDRIIRCREHERRREFERRCEVERSRREFERNRRELERLHELDRSRRHRDSRDLDGYRF